MITHDLVKPLNLPKEVNQRRQWHPTPVLLPGKSHGRKSLVGCGLWGRSESDTTKQLHFHFSLLCIGEGNGNPLQCSCLENPRDGGAWWASVSGVAQSRTRLKRLSSSSKEVNSMSQSCFLKKLQTFKEKSHLHLFITDNLQMTKMFTQHLCISL